MRPFPFVMSLSSLRYLEIESRVYSHLFHLRAMYLVVISYYRIYVASAREYWDGDRKSAFRELEILVFGFLLFCRLDVSGLLLLKIPISCLLDCCGGEYYMTKGVYLSF
jgi:hypothetical protein